MAKTEDHPCERVDYNSLYATMVQAASVLAENGEYEMSEELWASAVGVRMELDHRESDA